MVLKKKKTQKKSLVSQGWNKKKPLSLSFKLWCVWICLGMVSFIPDKINAQKRVAQETKGCVCARGFSEVAQKILPAVVDISGVGVATETEGSRMAASDGSDLTPEIPSNGSPIKGSQRRSLGAGFLVDGSGYILTNGHVIYEMSDVTVSLSDGSIYPAQIVGTDERTDLALLKIAAPIRLPSLEWGNSQEARVGDWVLVAGSPFGFGRSLSAGIISARARDISQMAGDGGPEGLFVGYVDDLIQTDAAINLGNSGGPMVNMHGEVIGVNVAIYSPSGGSVGIGFAVPSSVACRVYKALRASGHVSYGWIGVRVQEVDPFIASSLKAQGFYRKGIKGALVSGVDPEGSAARAGIEPSDIILGFGAQDIESYERLTRIVGETKPGTLVSVRLWRQGKLIEKKVQVEAWSLNKGEQKKQYPYQGDPLPYSSHTPGVVKDTVLGLSVLPVTPSMSGALSLPKGTKGLYIACVDAKGKEASMTLGGLRTGDVIVQVNSTALSTPQDLQELLDLNLSQGTGALLFKIWRQGQAHYIGVSLSS